MEHPHPHLHHTVATDHSKERYRVLLTCASEKERLALYQALVGDGGFHPAAGAGSGMLAQVSSDAVFVHGRCAGAQIISLGDPSRGKATMFAYTWELSDAKGLVRSARKLAAKLAGGLEEAVIEEWNAQALAWAPEGFVPESERQA